MVWAGGADNMAVDRIEDGFVSCQFIKAEQL